MIERTWEYYQREYVEKGRSPQDIADDFNTYPNKIRRELKKYKIPLRDKSKAQSTALKTGRHKHPTKGKKHSDQVKIAISETISKNWKYMDSSERNRRVELAKTQWKNMSDEEKENFKKSALEAVRETSKDGSKLERFVCDALRETGYEVSFHSEHILPNTRLQTDLYIPSLNTVIEIDGPTHFFPIWGKENLEKNIESDNKKNRLLLTYGFVIIRIKHISKNLSEKYKRDLLSTIINVLENIKKELPSLEKRLIEIEI